MKRIKAFKEFFSRPNNFSFKDLLALIFCGMFLFFCSFALIHKEDNYFILDLIKVLVPLIGIILGGYFGQEAIQAWKKNDYAIREYNNQTDYRYDNNIQVGSPQQLTYTHNNYDPRFDNNPNYYNKI